MKNLLLKIQYEFWSLLFNILYYIDQKLPDLKNKVQDKLIESMRKLQLPK